MVVYDGQLSFVGDVEAAKNTDTAPNTAPDLERGDGEVVEDGWNELSADSLARAEEVRFASIRRPPLGDKSKFRPLGEAPVPHGYRLQGGELPQVVQVELVDFGADLW